MSGEAGASLEGPRYRLAIGSGICEDIHVPHGDPDNAIADHFDRANAPYVRWLARARPDLDALFAADPPGLTLVAMDVPFEQIDGAVIDDVHGPDDARDRHFAAFHRGGPLLVHASDQLPDYQTVRLAVVVAARVRRSDLDALLARVAAILLAHRHEPPPPPPPLPPPPPPLTWFTRLRRWLPRL